jgi:hypothetical protein
MKKLQQFFHSKGDGRRPSVRFTDLCKGIILEDGNFSRLLGEITVALSG